MLRRLFIFLISGLLLALCTCSLQTFHPQLSVSVSVSEDQPQNARSNPSLSHLNCFLVVFGGNNFDDFSNADTGTRSHSCLHLAGKPSELVSLSTAQTGITASIPSGRYSIEVLGLTALNGDCSGKTIKELFAGEIPSLFSVANQSDVQINSGAQINLTSTFSAASPNLVPLCPPPPANTWLATSVGANALTIRQWHSAVWTGLSMILWGGCDNAAGGCGTNYYNNGVQYNQVNDSWTPVSTGINVPSVRGGHTAIWTGSKMIVWGGVGPTASVPLNTGGQYDPISNSWTTTSAGSNVPPGRTEHTAVWTGSKMIVWGGINGNFSALSSGGQYDPVANTWTTTSVGTNLPNARMQHTAVWTGSKMVVWGGCFDNACSSKYNSGGRYDPDNDTWLATSVGTNVPSARGRHTSVWTGSKMIEWGGFDGSGLGLTNTGGQYDPDADSWTATSFAPNVPGPRQLHSAIWTGLKMIIWGGCNPTFGGGTCFALNTGGQYDPLLDSWTPTSLGTNVPPGRFSLSVIWTGLKMIVWGGTEGNTGLNVNTGGVYTP